MSTGGYCFIYVGNFLQMERMERPSLTLFLIYSISSIKMPSPSSISSSGLTTRMFGP